MPFSVPYPDFLPDTPIVSAQMNANFAAVVAALNSGGGGSFTPSQGYVILPGGLTIQWGTVTVAADGSAPGVVTYAIPFPTALLGKPWCGISNPYATNPWALGAPQTNTESTTGFNVVVVGGPPSQTVTVGYMVLGY